MAVFEKKPVSGFQSIFPTKNRFPVFTEYMKKSVFRFGPNKKNRFFEKPVSVFHPYFEMY